MTARAARTLRALTARDVMRMQMVTVVPEMTVRELAQTLVEAGIRSVPVLGPTGKLVGVAALADVARLALRDGDGTAPHPAVNGNGNGHAPERLRVRDVMGPVGVTVLPGEPLPVLVRRFVHDREQRALVVENDMLLGIVTPVDVLSAIDEAP
jgi:CBS-domain-containing membrane protein